MKQHTNQFKQNIKTMGKEIDSIITYDNVTLHDELYSVSVMYESNLLKSVMKQLDIQSSVDIPIDTVIKYRLGIKIEGSYEYLDHGNYVVVKSEKQEDLNRYKITCYDKMVYSMKQNEDLGLTYPISLKNYLIAIGQAIGLQVENTTFANQNRMIPTELYAGLEYTYRDILDEIAQATGSNIIINSNDKLEVKYINNTNDTIDEEYLKDVNVTFKEKFGPVNTIVLSRSGEADNIYYPSPLPENPIQLKIVDNQIMNRNDRDEYLPELYAKLNGTEFYMNDFNSTGICYYDVCDMYNIRIGENTYKCLMLNDEINVTSGIEEIIHTEMPEQGETDYEKADKTDRRINQTYLIVDKQNQTIEAVVSNVSEQNQKISKLTQDVDEIKSEIQDIADVTESKESTTASVSIDDVNESEPVRIVVHPIGTNISFLYPSLTLYPSANLYMPVRILRFYNSTTEETFDYELPTDLLYYDADNYDEFILDYEGQSCVVNKRVGYNADGTTYVLANEQTIEYEYPTIELTDGDYTISLIGYEGGYLFARMMIKNIYTDQFATKAQLNSAIRQTVDDINLSVNQKLTNYSTTSEMNSAIDIKANQITSSVSETYETKTNASTNYNTLNNKFGSYYTKTETNSKIDQKAGEITSSVSETYETKVDSASNISNAKNEAITSANNSTDSKLTNYYTKNQTNSQINQKANEITSSVSATYITKTDSATNINTAKNAAINSANATTDTKLQSYSTTTQMNSAIDQKANQITSSVSQTYETKTDSTNKIATAKGEAIASANLSTDTKLTNYYTKSVIDQKTDTINLAVEGKLDESDFTGANIMVAVNNDGSSATINADKVNLSGYVTISEANTTYASKSGLANGTTTVKGDCITTGTIKSQNYVANTSGTKINLTDGSIDTKNFKVDSVGNMTCSNAQISGTITSSNATITGGDITLKANGTRILKVENENNNKKRIYMTDQSIVIDSASNLDRASMGIINGNDGYVSVTDSNNRNTMIFGSGISASQSVEANEFKVRNAGRCMYGVNNDYLYRCRWFDTSERLHFYVDNVDVGNISDERLKTDIKQVDERLIKAIGELDYKQFIKANRNGLVSVGIIAQDLMKAFDKYGINVKDYEIFDEFQYDLEDETLYYRVDYEQFLVLRMMYNEMQIQELKEKDKQKDEVIQDLIKRIEKLEKGE